MEAQEGKHLDPGHALVAELSLFKKSAPCRERAAFTALSLPSYGMYPLAGCHRVGVSTELEAPRGQHGDHASRHPGTEPASGTGKCPRSEQTCACAFHTDQRRTGAGTEEA